MRQRDVAAPDAKYTKELADAKAENDASRVMMLPLVVVGCTSCQSVSQCEPPRLSKPDNAASPLTGRHCWTGLFHPQREADHYANNWKEPRSILMSSVDRVAHIDGQPAAITVSNTHALPASINAWVNKTEQSIYECLLASVLTTFSAPPQILLHRQFSSAQSPETKKWWVMVSFGATAAGLFWTVNVCWDTSCNKQGQRSSE